MIFFFFMKQGLGQKIKQNKTDFKRLVINFLAFQFLKYSTPSREQNKN